MHKVIKVAIEDSIHWLRIARQHKDSGYPKTLADLVHWVRIARDEAREELEASLTKSDDVFVMPTFEDHRAAFAVAARNAYLQGASEKQVDYLAKLAFDAGESTTYPDHMLTSRTASALISDYLRG